MLVVKLLGTWRQSIDDLQTSRCVPIVITDVFWFERILRQYAESENEKEIPVDDDHEVISDTKKKLKNIFSPKTLISLFIFGTHKHKYIGTNIFIMQVFISFVGILCPPLGLQVSE